jgi:hypothetical protein
MTANNQLKNSIYKYLSTYNLFADFDTNKIYDENGVQKGIYDIENSSNIEDDGRILISFYEDSDTNLTIIPTLILHF